MDTTKDRGIIDECFLIWVKIMEQAGGAGPEKPAARPSGEHEPTDSGPGSPPETAASPRNVQSK